MSSKLTLYFRPKKKRLTLYVIQYLTISLLFLLDDQGLTHTLDNHQSCLFFNSFSLFGTASRSRTETCWARNYCKIIFRWLLLLLYTILMTIWIWNIPVDRVEIRWEVDKLAMILRDTSSTVQLSSTFFWFLSFPFAISIQKLINEG